MRNTAAAEGLSRKSWAIVNRLTGRAGQVERNTSSGPTTYLGAFFAKSSNLFSMAVTLQRDRMSAKSCVYLKKKIGIGPAFNSFHCRCQFTRQLRRQDKMNLQETAHIWEARLFCGVLTLSTASLSVFNNASMAPASTHRCVRV